ncbi:Tripartite motif-containing protein 2 [Mizuhopecten yessoensis]|uniref:Tripartite motif-containing protein 2 n=2 Tax=Mizuhopecten yessoensis TaxID=6573 RepID=A0A210QTK5_MIZYE|nr:Tripartite motif-containing protein 2 [Mizuhopecten yessoensis]
MSEGETADTPTIVSSDLTETHIDVDPRLTECPVCLEQLRHPNSLPCLHTFCEECLNVYITKESDTPIVSFPCPVCRAETIPVDPKEEKGNWAKQFPTNNFIIEMSRGYARKSLIHECDPCKKRDVRNIAAKVWWKESNCFYVIRALIR